MKVKINICLIAVLAITMFTSVGSAQTGITPTVDAVAPVTPVAPVAPVDPETVVPEVPSNIISQPDDSMVVSEQEVPAQPAFETTSEVVGSGCYLPAPVVQSCDCNETSCVKCRPVRERRTCGCKRVGCRGGCKVAAESKPMFESCEGDFCKLSIKKGKEKKTCFKTEQETICIPAVRLPWQDCCPPSKSRTRLVTRLKTEKKEVESCSYKWTVDETNDCGSCAPAKATPAGDQQAERTVEGSVEADPVAKPPVEPKVSKEAFEENVVPPAPKVKGAFLKAFRQR